MGKPIPEPDAPEVRARAVQRVRSSGLSKAQVAQSLETGLEALRRWSTQAEGDAGRRRAVAILKEQREILTKPAAFFAAGSTTR